MKEGCRKRTVPYLSDVGTANGVIMTATLVGLLVQLCVPHFVVVKLVVIYQIACTALEHGFVL